MEENEIVELFFDRDENAIAQTEKKYGKLCGHIAKNILGDEQDSAECVNDTYLALWNSIPPQRPKSLMAFICKVARNIALKRYEYNSAKKRSAEVYVDIAELADVLADTDIAPDTSEEDIGFVINEFLKTEKESARNVFLQKYWFFDSVEVIAKRNGFSESKVKSMLFQTRARLKIYLKDKGVHL